MISLSPTKGARTSRKQPAVSPYQWLDRFHLSQDELKGLREHIERQLQMEDGELIR